MAYYHGIYRGTEKNQEKLRADNPAETPPEHHWNASLERHL
jgi:hypothetical protein